MAVKARFTRIPKVHEMISAGIPTEVIPTYCALADYSNNKTGLCWPRMETLARKLCRSPRTIQRHLHLLKEKGLIEFVERKRDWHGRFGAYVYRVIHIAAVAARKGRDMTSERDRRTNKKRPTTGQGGRVASNKRQTKQNQLTPLPPIKDLKDGYEWLFDPESSSKVDHAHKRQRQEQRMRSSDRRKEGYEWLFG